MSNDRVTDLAADGYPETGVLHLVGRRVEDQEIPVAATALAIAPEELGPAPQPLRAWERLVATLGGRPAGHRLGRETLATFPTPPLDDRLPLARLHARAEAVLLLAASVVGLKRTFHGSWVLYVGQLLRTDTLGKRADGFHRHRNFAKYRGNCAFVKPESPGFSARGRTTPRGALLASWLS